MDLRSRILFALSRSRIRPAEAKTVDYGVYADWRRASLARSWSHFADASVAGKDVLDFGCGDGPLSLFIAREKKPRSVVGVDLGEAEIRRAQENLAARPLPDGVTVEFRRGSVERMPVEDSSADVLLAFDCLEHVMQPAPILRDWHRALRPGGRCLIEWFPYKGPWGPHMESLIPVPWAHVIFGQRAMFRAAEAIYDLPEFQPRHWDLEADGRKKPNKWRAWSSFREQGYINELDLAGFRRHAAAAGFRIARLEKHSFGGSALRRGAGRALMSLPFAGEYFLNFVIVELERPA